MSKAGFPVAEATRNYIDLHLPAQRELAYLTPEEITRLVSDACQKMAEYGWMRGWEAARLQGALGGPVVAEPRRKLAHEAECGVDSHRWGCERQQGHFGNHMAWEDYDNRILYNGGSWK